MVCPWLDVKAKVWDNDVGRIKLIYQLWCETIVQHVCMKPTVQHVEGLKSGCRSIEASS